jgi:hypothetical protein
MLPALYQTCDTTTGERWSSWTMSFKPLSNLNSCTLAAQLLMGKANNNIHALLIRTVYFSCVALGL